VSDAAAQYRAELDFEITFSNGGSLRGEGFRIDIAGPDVSEDDLGAALIADLGLLMADRVEIRRYQILSERHKRAAASPRAVPGTSGAVLHRADLSHPIEQGMVTIPGLPAPRIMADSVSAQLPPGAYALSAVPPRVTGFGTFPVRAYATWEAAP
jgi:hypothetical protein